ncbi:MAG: murein transglycosylase A [Parvularculaceae bacterium]
MISLTPLRAGLALILVMGLIGLAYTAGARREPPANPGSRVPEELVPVGVAANPSSFEALAGWTRHDPAAAIAALGRSCVQLLGLPPDAPANPHEALGPGARTSAGQTFAGRAQDWRAACEDATAFLSAPPADTTGNAARAFFETHFRPVRLVARMAPKSEPAQIVAHEEKGRFTAYFEPSYPASDRQTTDFSAPVLARPADLVTVDLGLFRPELAGQRIAGSVTGGALAPYPDHAAINAGALQGRTDALAWMRPGDLLFLQIQGSGRLQIAGAEMRVGYDGHNGHLYTAVGKTLIERGALSRETVSMQTIRAWLDAADPGDAAKVRESNRSYIFFRRLDALPDPSLGPPGADGVQLTPMVSLAVDPRWTPLGAPVWVDIDGDEPIRQLMIAQDRGGAIKGPVRGDLYAGSGESAGEFAGAFNRMGTMTLLLPVAGVARLEGAGAP